MNIGQKKILGLALLVSGLALCCLGLWLLLSPAQYAATVRIKVELDINDTYGAFNIQSAYSSHFIQPTLETIQSEMVLSNVVANLNLNTDWLSIKKHLHLKPVRNTQLIAITFSSSNTNEAAQVANMIAEVYRDYRTNLRMEMLKKGLEVLQWQYQDEEKRISLQTTNSEQQLEMHKLLKAKIEAEKLDSKIPRTPVQIVDRAEPPQFPVGPNRSLGVAMLTAGLLSLFGGIRLPTSSRQSAV